MFDKAFPGEPKPISKENIAKAIATFERGIQKLHPEEIRCDEEGKCQI